jgi:signal transduction histidine kinase
MIRNSHRWRITLVASGSAAVLFLVMFGLAWWSLRETQLKSANELLKAAVRQVSDDLKSPNRRADVAEVVRSNPEVSLAVYDQFGVRVASAGRFNVSATSESGLRDDILYKVAGSDQYRIVAAIDWYQYQASVRQLELMGALLSIPFVALVALATWLAAHATFLPLEQLAKAAEQMSGESLSARLHVEDSGEYREFVLRLNRFLDKLEASVRREERFLSDAAHELRTPLTVLRGEIETVLMKERTANAYRATLEVLHDETSRLSSLVELLLRSAVPVADHAKPLDMVQAAERAHARWVDRFADKGIQLQLSLNDAKAEISDSEFDVVIDNMLSNSLRATDRPSVCTISIGQSSGYVNLEVKDEGCGVPPESVPTIFDRFSRADTGRSRTDGGFGIGLAVTKRLLESRRGTVEYRPNKPHGSIFIARIPAS